jgi:prophage regulatory protein
MSKRVLSFSDLVGQKGIRYSRVHLYRLVHGRKFPAPLRLSANRVAWLEDEVDAWLAARAAERDAAQ